MNKQKAQAKMKRRLISLLLSVVFPVAILVVLTPAVLTSAEEQAAPLRGVSMILVRQRDGSREQIANIQLSSRKVAVRQGETIEQLLESNGIYADGESLAVLYTLNPGREFASIEAGAEVIIPIVQGGRELSVALEKGYLVALILDKELKKKILKQIKELTDLSASVSDFGPQRFENPKRQNQILDSLQHIVYSLEVFRTVIRQRNRPINAEVLRQLKGETEVLNSLLHGIIETKRQITNSDEETLILVAENMDVRMGVLDEQKGTPGDLPSRWPQVRVVVNALSTKFGHEAHNFRVYYVPQALASFGMGYVESFDKLTSPSSEGNLPPANYLIWAGIPGDPEPVSDVKKLRARGNEKSVELIISD